MQVWTIYCHTHIESGRRYIGLTSKTMMFRWNQHIQNAKTQSGKGCAHFWNAIRKYGNNAFSHEAIACSQTLENANATEEALILQYDTMNPESGFNLVKGGLHVPHPIKIKKNPWNDPEYREKQLTHMMSPSKRYALAHRMIGKSLNAESREKISSSLRKRIISQETREKISVAGIGRMRLNATVATHSASDKDRTHCRYGHTLSDAYIRKRNGERICRTCARKRIRRQSYQT